MSVTDQQRTDAPRVVLSVEDDPAIQSLITDVLEEEGYRVLAARNGAEALEVLGRTRPNVVVLDLLMPVMHGWEFMETYAERTGGAKIPIVVVSVNAVLPRSFDRFGVVSCISKPFQINELLQAVEEAVHKPVAA